MEPFTSLAIGGGLQALSGIANYFANSSAADRAQAMQEKAMQEWLKVNIPDPAQQKLAMDHFVQQGTLTPELEQAIVQGPSEMSKVTSDPAQRAAQMRALSQMEDIGSSGGLRLQDKAALQKLMIGNQAKERGERDSINAEMARRGLGGSGFEFASKLGAQQAGADRNAQNSLNIAAQARDRALQAIMDSGELAGKYRSQQFGEDSQKAQAQDAINRFNTSAMQDANTRNVAARNQANQMNLAASQKIADMNTNLGNDQQKYNKQLQQQQFENQAKIAAGKTGQYAQMEKNAQQQGQNTGNMFSNIGNTASGAFTALANKQANTKAPSYASLPPGYTEDEEEDKWRRG